MNISEKGIEFISSFEGFKDESYRDSGGVWTIGYGHTGNVKPGQKLQNVYVLINYTSTTYL